MFQRKSEKGQGLLEYSQILVLVSIIVIVVLVLLGPAIGDMYGYVIANLPF